MNWICKALQFADSLTDDKKGFSIFKKHTLCVVAPAVVVQVLNTFLCQILDELIIAGELEESSKKSVLRVVCMLC